MTAYYNEIDGAAAQWLRNLIEAGHIAPGIVDTRSIEDVHPSDLRGFTQCHFFAGIGVWSHALRNAGVPDSRSLWTGSCPCQPFSAAGAGAGLADERHLWPAFHHLIKECSPAVVFGEQVASKAAEPWIDALQIDMEALGYGVAAIAFPSSSVGAPHIRDRLYWVADAQRERVCPCRRGKDACAPRSLQGADGERQRLRLDAGELCGVCGLADANGNRCSARSEGCTPLGHGKAAGPDCGAVIVGNASSAGLAQRFGDAGVPGWAPGGNEGQTTERAGIHAIARPGPTNGFWRAADWLGCRDGKWRPVEPGTFPLATGAAARVVRLRAYGNAINSAAAQAFIESVMDGEAMRPAGASKQEMKGRA